VEFTPARSADVELEPVLDEGRLMVTEHDASGAVKDNCDSGTVRWKAKQ